MVKGSDKTSGATEDQNWIDQLIEALGNSSGIRMEMEIVGKYMSSGALSHQERTANNRINFLSDLENC